MNRSSLSSSLLKSRIVFVSFSMRSHLFTATTIPFPASCATPAIFLSCSVSPSAASIISTHTSQRSMAATALNTLYLSISSLTLLFLRIPAVSIRIYFSPSFSKGVSIESLVVPAIGDTITLFSPRRQFIREDFPTLGFPITAIFIVSSSSSPAPSGKLSTISSRTSPKLSMFAAETGIGSPRPSS